MAGIILATSFLLIALYGYYISVKPSKLESEIRKTKSDYSCFECKKVIDINALKCPECGFVTLYGKRKGKFFLFIPIFTIYGFMLVKFLKTGVINF